MTREQHLLTPQRRFPVPHGRDRWLLVLAGCVCLTGLLPAPTAADPEAPPQPEAPTPRAPVGGSALKSTLVSRLHQINQTVIKAGEWARTKGATSQVRAYGDLLVRDHARADHLMLGVAETQGIPVGEPTPKDAQEEEEMKQQTATMEQLLTLQGRAFNTKFLEFMHKGHKSALTMLQSSRGRLTSATPLPLFIETLIPILRQHYHIAIELEMDEILRGGDEP